MQSAGLVQSAKVVLIFVVLDGPRLAQFWLGTRRGAWVGFLKCCLRWITKAGAITSDIKRGSWMGPHRSASKDPVRVHVELWLVEMDLGERGGRSLPITYAGTEHCSKVSASLKSASGRELEVGKKIHMHQNCIRQSSPKKGPIAYIWAVCLRKSAWIGYYLVRPSICCPDVIFLCNIESGLLPFVCAKIGRVKLPSGT